jgi:hypothetical protein
MYLEILMTQFEHIIVAFIIQTLLIVLFLNPYLYSKRNAKETEYWKKILKFLGL